MTGHEERLRTVVDLGNALKDCVDTGMYLFAKVHPAGAAFLAVAYTVKNLISSYGLDDPVVRELKNLGRKMDTLLNRMASHFTAFKSYYVENQFWNDVPLQTSVLIQYMEDVKSEPTNDNLKSFQALYEKTNPVKLARKLNYQLKREVMNPLMHAMDADPLMTVETFEMWNGLIESVFMQLWEIEIMAGVWIHNEQVQKVEEMEHVKEVQDEIEKYRVAVKKWDEEYSQGAAYWPEKVRKIIEDVLDNEDRFAIHTKADMIARDLEFIHTKAIFYVVVFPETAHFVKHDGRENQVVVVEKHHKCTAVVYRSLQAYGQSEAVVSRAGHMTTFLRLPPVVLGKADWIQQSHIDSWAKGYFTNCGMLLAVDQPHHISVKFTKADKHKRGPGDYRRCEILGDSRSGINNSHHFVMVAGYK